MISLVGLVNIFLLVEYTALNCSLQLKVSSILIHSHNAARVNFLRPKYPQVRSFIKLNHAFWIKFNFPSLPSIIFVLPTSSDSSPGTQSVNNSWSSINFLPGMVPDTTHLTLYSLGLLNHGQSLSRLESQRFLCLFTLFFPCREHSSSLLYHDKCLWLRKQIPWSRKWQTTPVFLPGKFLGQGSLEYYSPWGCKGSNTTEHMCTHSCINNIYIHIHMLL